MTQIGVTWPYVLQKGHSDDPSRGACAMDAINWLVHGRHGDAPECACRVIAPYVISGNDAMPDDVRQRLLPYLHRIAGSRSAAHEAVRMRVLWLAAVRVFAPLALDAAGLVNEATNLRALPDDVAPKEAEAAAEAARASAWAAAWAAARGAAAWAAARAAVEAARAARAAAEAAAWEPYFAVLDLALSAGPQGEPWSADFVFIGAEHYRAAGGLVRVP